jgi:hypothetical protein
LEAVPPLRIFVFSHRLPPQVHPNHDKASLPPWKGGKLQVPIQNPHTSPVHSPPHLSVICFVCTLFFSIRTSFYLSLYPSISTHLPTYVPIHLSIYLPIHLSVCVPTYTYINLCIYLRLPSPSPSLAQTHQSSARHLMVHFSSSAPRSRPRPSCCPDHSPPNLESWTLNPKPRPLTTFPLQLQGVDRKHLLPHDKALPARQGREAPQVHTSSLSAPPSPPLIPRPFHS